MNEKKLERTVFEINRELEFFSEKELEMQIGHGKEWWPIAMLKELIDNSLDACEINNIAPEITISIGEDYFSVFDNGPGLSNEILTKSLNYLKRISDKTLYVSPTRGQMGNALKTIWAAPFVLNGEYGKIEIWSQGLHHIIDVSIDRIAQKPILNHTKENSDFVKTGTLFKIYIENSTSLNERLESYFYNPPPIAEELIENYSAFNPHTTILLDTKLYEATNKEWTKWRPDNPTSPHWYSIETLRDLIAGYIIDERSGGKIRTVREFVSEFRGLSSTLKQKEVTEGLSNVYLHDLIKGEDIDKDIVEKLLKKMQEASKPLKSSLLGLIGEDHFKKWMVKYANVTEESINYTKKMGIENNLPHLVEVAFGINENDNARRRIIQGLNWSASLGIPMQVVQEILRKSRIDHHDPIVLMVHVAKPRFEFVDRGKTRLTI